MIVEDIDGGVVYTHNAHTMSFVGMYEDGEVHVDDVLHAYYERDEEDGNTLLSNADGDIIKILNDEYDYETYALEVLSKL
jgi:hypothetical protein